MCALLAWTLLASNSMIICGGTGYDYTLEFAWLKQPPQVLNGTGSHG